MVSYKLHVCQIYKQYPFLIICCFFNYMKPGMLKICIINALFCISQLAFMSIKNKVIVILYHDWFIIHCTYSYFIYFILNYLT